MTIIDGQLDGSNVDKIRIKIYNKNTNEVIYDNQPGASETANPTTVVGLNSTIVINNTGAALTKAHRLTNEDSGESHLDLVAMPNPTTSSFTMQLNSSNTKDHITLQVFDQYGRMIETQKTFAGSNLNIGGLYRPGVYYVRIMQGKEHKQVKLLKLPD
jgi:hypothetical protein